MTPRLGIWCSILLSYGAADWLASFDEQRGRYERGRLCFAAEGRLGKNYRAFSATIVLSSWAAPLGWRALTIRQWALR